MNKKLWNNPKFTELGVEKTECLPTTPVCPPTWTATSGAGTSHDCGHSFGPVFKPEPKKHGRGWW